jgi:hypothetical protein
VAVGDVHGAYDELIGILTAAHLIDDQHDWAGGDTIFVQLGDFTDRGPKVREVIDLLRKLQEQAVDVGGQVEVLMGNHEALNLVGELRDIGPRSLDGFAAEASEERRQAEYEKVVAAARRRAKLTGAARPTNNASSREIWMKEHPPGTIPYLESLLQNGEYGHWLRERPAMMNIDGTLFLHGGLNPDLSTRRLQDINSQVRQEIWQLDDCREVLEDEGFLALTDGSTPLIQAGFSRLAQLQKKAAKKGLDDTEKPLLEVLSRCSNYEDWHLFSSEGPLWFRGYAPSTSKSPEGEPGRWSDEEGSQQIAAVLENQGVKRVAVGHTPQIGGSVRVRFEGRVFLIDTGMLTEVYRGRAAAIEIAGDIVTAIYPDGREILWQGAAGSPTDAALQPTAAQPAPTWSWRGPDGAMLPFSSPEELESFLASAKVISKKTISQGINRPTKVLLEKDGVQANAIFRNVSLEIRGKAGPSGKFFRLWQDSFAFELAAYEVAKFLGIERIPPVVPRHLFGTDGSLQAWVEDAMVEAERLEKKLTPPDLGLWAHQQSEKHVFDALINNEDRHEGNSLIDADWNVWLIDHTRAFFTEHGDEKIDALKLMPRPLWTQLRHVDREALRKRLRPHLNALQIEALFDRWDRVLLHIRTLVSEYGSEAVLVER